MTSATDGGNVQNSLQLGKKPYHTPVCMMFQNRVIIINVLNKPENAPRKIEKQC
jgi:hypothetical protein